MPRRWSGDAGVSVVEVAVLTPVVIILLGILPLQLGLLYQEKQLLSAAAHEGARAAARADTPSPVADGQAAAAAFLDHTGAVTGPQVQVDRGADVVTVTVTASGATIIPGTRIELAARARTRVEQFVGAP